MQAFFVGFEEMNPATLEKLQAEADSAIEKFLDDTARHSSLRDRILIPRTLRIFWNPRMRSRLGVAKCQINCIELNARLLTDHPQELVPTLLHEMAHVFVWLKNPHASAHGWQWQGMMRKLGQQPTRCHALDTKHLKQKRRKFATKCGCMTHIVGIQRARKIRNGAAYRCRLCGSRLEYVGPARED